MDVLVPDKPALLLDTRRQAGQKTLLGLDCTCSSVALAKTECAVVDKTPQSKVLKSSRLER